MKYFLYGRNILHHNIYTDFSIFLQRSKILQIKDLGVLSVSV